MTINDDLLRIIGELSDRSRSGDINWEKINPSTFKLVQDVEGRYVTLQRVDASRISDMLGGVVKYHYILQAIAEDSKGASGDENKKILFKLNSADREDYNALLSNLFDAIYNGIEKNVANLLGGFLK